MHCRGAENVEPKLLVILTRKLFPVWQLLRTYNFQWYQWHPKSDWARFGHRPWIASRTWASGVSEPTGLFSAWHWTWGRIVQRALGLWAVPKTRPFQQRVGRDEPLDRMTGPGMAKPSGSGSARSWGTLLGLEREKKTKSFTKCAHKIPPTIRRPAN